MKKLRFAVVGSSALIATLLGAACDNSDGSSSGSGAFDAGGTSFDGATAPPVDSSVADTSTGVDAADAADAASADGGRVLAEGLSDPIPYLSRADSLFAGVSFASYFYLEDWEDGLVNTPGVTPTSTQTGFGALADSVDADDTRIDGKCLKDGNVSCNSGFDGSGTIGFSFDAAVLGALPTHVGIVWTDGAPSCDAIFQAYDADNVLIGTKTAAMVGDGDNSGGTAEDRFFSVVHATGVMRIVVSSSAGGVEVDHLQYGR